MYEFNTSSEPIDIKNVVNFMYEKYPELISNLRRTEHNYTNAFQNTFHTEDVLSHTLMVCRFAELYKASNNVKFAAMFHDMGKPLSLERDDIKLKNKFHGHSGLSVYMSVEPLHYLVQKEVISKKDAVNIIKLISWHQDIYTALNDDNFWNGKNTKKLQEEFRQRFSKEECYSDLQMLTQCDFDGRIFYNTEVNRVFDVPYTPFEGIDDINENAPELVMLVGPQNSGKSTYRNAISKSDRNYVIISRDDTLMQYAKDNNIMLEGDTYIDVWGKLTEHDQNEISKIEFNEFMKAVKERRNIIIDETLMSRSTRRKYLTNTKGYRKRAEVMIVSLDELRRRNIAREGKIISCNVIRETIQRFSAPGYDEFHILNYHIIPDKITS